MRFFKQSNQSSLLLHNSSSKSDFRVLQPIWDLRIGREHVFASSVFPVFLTIGGYFASCIFYGVLDMALGRWFKRYRIQDDKEVTWPMVWRCVRRTMMNNFVYILPVTIAQFVWVPDTPLPAKAPTLSEFVFQIVAMLFIFDFQYGTWHACHHKSRWLYRTFHSIHHQYHSTFSWVTQYMHPWEMLTTGFFATVNGWFFECHPMTYWGFMLLNIFMSVEAHSGYDFPFFAHNWIPFHLYGGGPKHDMHHMRPLTNFQPYFTYIDRLLGTDCPWLGAQRFKSARLLAWEEKNKRARKNKTAFQLMGGTENGYLTVDKDPRPKKE